ncbi:hypothetical protein WJX79_009306 [Trebouxia sp. C0005]
MSGSDAEASQAQLQLLLAELKRIEGQQQQLKTAAAENKVLIVHPVKGFDLDEEDEYAEEEEVKPNPDRFIPSGGLTGFEVAKDLMKIDFSPPSEAPEEFRALTFTAPPMKKGQGKPALLASQIYHQGSFGAMDPASHDLYMFLEKLQEQQKEVVKLIKERQRIVAEKNGTPMPSPPLARTASPPPLPLPPTTSNLRPASPVGPVGDAAPTNPSRFANAAARDAAFKRAKEAGMPRENGVPIMGLQTQVMAMRMEGGGVTQGTAPGVEVVTSTGSVESRAGAVTEGGVHGQGYQLGITPSSAGQGPARITTVPGKQKKNQNRCRAIPIDMTFGEGLKTRPRRTRPSSPSPWGWVIFVFYIATFIFYAYCRIGHTLTSSDSAFAYQVIFLILELGTFVSGVLFGFCQLCKLHSDKPEKISEMAHRLRGTPEPQIEAEEKTPAAALDKDGKPLPGAVDKDGKPLPGAVDKDGKPLPGAADSKDLNNVTSPKSKKAEPAYIPRRPLTSKYHIQVLVWSGPQSTADGARCKAALLAAHNMTMPVGADGNHCTRIVYLVDPVRNPAKMELVRELAMDGILYMPGPDVVTATTDLSKGASLNRVLRKIYPRGTQPKPTDLVAVFHDDQIAHPTFLDRTLPAIEGKQVRMAHVRPAYENISLHGDVFSQINQVEYDSWIPGYEALGFCSPSSSAFIVRADALQKCNWLPMYSRAPHLALGQELKLQEYLCHYINMPLAVGIAPESIAQLYASKRMEAQGQFQMYYHTRPAYALGHLSMKMRLLYGAHAWTNQVVALMMPVWVAVPIIQVIFGVFPFDPNRWFGLGFLLYWCIGTPLLFKSYRFGHARGLWHYTVTQHNLWATYCLCLIRTWMGICGPRQDTQVVQDLPPHARKIKGEDVALSPTHKLGITPSIFQDTEKAFLGVGMWLLFGTNGIQGGSESTMSLSVLASNMPFVVSLLWLFYHTVMFTIPLLWAFAVATSRPGSSPPCGAAGGFTVSSPPKTGPDGPPDTPRTAAPAEVREKGSLGCLGVYSYLAWALCWAAVLLVAIACLGIGDGTISSWAAYDSSKDTDYSSLLSKSLAFYEAQQSGALSSNPISWRADSGLTDLPLGGWYEGGSNLKLTFPTAIAATQLAWAMIAVPGAFTSTPSTKAHLASLKWGTDYLLACRPSSTEFVAQVGDYASEMDTWDRPENMTTTRTNITISTANSTSAAGADLVGNAAAALAAASIVWETADSTYAADALIAAKDLYTFAQSVPGLYTSEYSDAALSYPSTSYLDDMAYAASWMYYATKETAYLTDAVDYYNEFINGASSIAAVNNWDNQFYATSLLLWQLTGNTTYEDKVEYFLSSWYNGENSITYLSSGIAWSSANGGAFRNTANAAFLALLFRLGESPYNSRTYACWARRQIQYLAGSGTSQGYVVGFGDTPPLLATHRGASCADSVANCTGTVISSAEYLATSVNPHVLNVSIEYNSAFMGAVAVLANNDWDICWKRNGILDQTGHYIGN